VVPVDVVAVGRRGLAVTVPVTLLVAALKKPI
jgi:hypothetical protein